MASRKTGYVLAGFILSLVGFLLSLAGFATPFWIQPFNKDVDIIQIDNLGLWQFCFSGYTAARRPDQDYDILGKRYVGCKWVFEREVHSIQYDINPPWFRIAQTLISLDVVGSAFVVLMGAILLCLNMCDEYPTVKEGRCYQLLGIISSASGYICAAGVLVFGYYSDSKDWAIQNPDLYHLSWSYFFSVFGGGFSIFGGMFLLLAWMQVKIILKAKRPNYKPTLELATLTPTMRY